MDGAITQLVELAREVGGEAWPFLVERAVVGAWVNLIWCPVVLMISSAAFYFAIRETVRRWDYLFEHDFELAVIPICIVLGVITLVSFIALIVTVPNNIVTIIAPEGAVLKSLLTSAKG